jgi:L-fuculose-phosphate aldolase
MRPFISEHDAILLENHGAVSYGVTLLDAFMKMETVEHLAHIALIAHQLGSARPLRRARVQQLQSARTGGTLKTFKKGGVRKRISRTYN